MPCLDVDHLLQPGLRIHPTNRDHAADYPARAGLSSGRVQAEGTLHPLRASRGISDNAELAWQRDRLRTMPDRFAEPMPVERRQK
jgi:hypothetical protein